MIQYKLTAKAKTMPMLNFIPKQAHPTDAGYDLAACLEESLKIFPGQVEKIPLGVHVALGEEAGNWAWVGMLFPRSSCKGLRLTNTVGILDSSYQGELFAKYENTSEEIVTIVPGQRIVQLVITQAFVGSIQEVEEFEEVTERGEGGDGSSGK